MPVGLAALVAVALVLMLAPVAQAGPGAPAAAAALAGPSSSGYDVKDVGPELRAKAPSIMRVDLSSLEAPGSLSVGPAVLGDVRYWLILDDYYGTYRVTNFTLRSIGQNCEIWVQNNLAYPAGDPRPTDVITDAQLNYIRGQFDNVIYPKETAFFGTPEVMNGTNAALTSMLGLPDGYYDGDKLVVLISNIRDEMYYNPSYPIYIAGFYSPSFEFYFDRNIITIDSRDWANRLGPTASRPFLYEGVIAHELQHLVHDDMDGDEETWVNEGCADFAEFICGYAAATKGHVDAVAQYPENSLVLWEDQGALEILSDYGHAYLWTLYLSEKFGSSFIQKMVRNTDNGIAGVNSTLRASGISKTFAQLYRDWTVALVIDSATPGSGAYEFKSLAFTLNLGTPTAPNVEAFGTPGAPPWGTDYIWVNDLSKVSKVLFDGADQSAFPTAWTSNNGVLWSGSGDLADHWAIFPAKGGGTLSFDTLWDIEDYWDFGFVQVSTDGGYTWTSLENAFTTSDYDPNAHPKIIENLPGLTGTHGWVNMSFDLSAYAGDVLIAFRYVTDWGTTYDGWFIDNVRVNGKLISDCSSTAAFKDITQIFPTKNDFTVTFVGMRSTAPRYKVVTIRLDAITEQGMLDMIHQFVGYTKVLMLVTAEMPEGFPHYVDYGYDRVLIGH